MNSQYNIKFASEYKYPADTHAPSHTLNILPINNYIYIHIEILKSMHLCTFVSLGQVISELLLRSSR